METSPPRVNIPHPGHFLSDFAHWRCRLSRSLAFPREGRAVKRNEHREKWGCAGDVSIEVLVQAIRRPHSTSLRPSVEGKIITTLFRLKGSGLAESTLKHVSWHLSFLAGHCDLDSPVEVADFLANMKGANSYKDTFVKSYNTYVQLNGLCWKKPTYRWERKIPKIPTTEALNKIISRASKKYALIFRVLMETGDYNTYRKKYAVEIPPTALFFNEIGVLLNKKLIDIDLVNSLFGGVIMRYWERAKPMLESGRRELNQPRWGLGT